MNRLLSIWAQLPEGVKQAIVAGVAANVVAAGMALKMWLKARFFKGAFSNVVEAIHSEGCSDCAAAFHAANVEDSIVAKVAPFVEQIKARLDAAAKEAK